MKEYDLKLNEESIGKSIDDNNLGRNSKLNKLMELLNGINSNRIIAVDGKWGCGKTVFLKQLEYLSKNAIDSKAQLTISPEVSQQFKEKYDVYYYNAWENDYHASPLLSLIYNLMISFPHSESQNASGEIESPFDFKSFFKTVSSDLYNPDRIESYKDLVDEICTVEKRRGALNNIIDYILPDNKRLVFIIDELDRCRPDYAINMLEVIKHFYMNERIVFLIGVNNEQLSYTISNYYGNNFDGYGYLNKFYDLVIELDEITPSLYLNTVIKRYDSDDWIDGVLHCLCNYYKFQMRDINRLLNDYDLLDEYFNSNVVGAYADDVALRYIFLPYCLALKIKSKHKLREFLEGEGYIALEKFAKSSNKIKQIVEFYYENTAIKGNMLQSNEDEIFKYFKTRYDEYFNNDSNDSYQKRSKKIFTDILSLLSNYTTIRRD